MSPRILGVGYAVPQAVRTNDDPIFDWLKKHPVSGNPFWGYVDRRVLSPGETAMTIMLPAAQSALGSAGLQPSQVDMLLGCGSISQFWDPNDLCELHHLLGLPQSAWTVPLNNEFSNFNAGVLFADALVRAGRIRNALIVCGCNWTRHVDYHTIQSFSAGDGAGAAVVGDSQSAAQWTVVDHETITDSSYFGSMFMMGTQKIVSGECVWTCPFFQITPEGMKGFGAFGVNTAPLAVTNMLQRRGLKGSDIALIAHQASQVLFDKWSQVIQPRQLLQTIQQFANMVVASNPVNLAYAMAQDGIQTNWLVSLSLGPDMHANALLLARSHRAV